MSQFPPAVPPPNVNYAPPAPRPANVLAIISLICGILGCFVITPIVAIVTGALGLGKARVQGGRGLAITGIILGLLWIVGGLAAVGGGMVLWKNAAAIIAQTAKPQTMALLDRVAAGDVSVDATTGNLTADDLKSLAAVATPLGHCKDISVNSSSIAIVNNQASVKFGGTATFEHGQSPINVAMHNPQGTAKNAGAWVFDSVELK